VREFGKGVADIAYSLRRKAREEGDGLDRGREGGREGEGGRYR